MSYNFRIKNFVIARYHSVSSKNNLHIGPHHQISLPKTPKDVNVTLSIIISTLFVQSIVALAI